MSAPPRNKRDTPARLDLDGDALDGFLGGIELRTPTGRKPPSPNLQNIPIDRTGVPPGPSVRLSLAGKANAEEKYLQAQARAVAALPKATIELDVERSPAAELLGLLPDHPRRSAAEIGDALRRIEATLEAVDAKPSFYQRRLMQAVLNRRDIELPAHTPLGGKTFSLGIFDDVVPARNGKSLPTIVRVPARHGKTRGTFEQGQSVHEALAHAAELLGFELRDDVLGSKTFSILSHSPSHERAQPKVPAPAPLTYRVSVVTLRGVS